MYAITIIRRVDELRPNSISGESKAAWLARCDGQIYDRVIRNHEGAHCMRPFMGKTEMEAEYGEMMIKEPYDAIYDYYLMAQIDMTNGDWHHYENSMTLYNSALDEWARKWHREHMPCPGPKMRI